MRNQSSQLFHNELHDNEGHLSTDKVTEHAKETFFLFRMEKDIKQFINKVYYCIKEKKSNITKAVPLKAILSRCPMGLVSTNFMQVGTCTGDISNY